MPTTQCKWWVVNGQAKLTSCQLVSLVCGSYMCMYLKLYSLSVPASYQEVESVCDRGRKRESSREWQGEERDRGQEGKEGREGEREREIYNGSL